MDLGLAEPRFCQDVFHFFCTRLAFVECDKGGRIEDETFSHAPAPWPVLPAAGSRVLVRCAGTAFPGASSSVPPIDAGARQVAGFHRAPAPVLPAAAP